MYSIIWLFNGENVKKGINYDGNLSSHTLSVCDWKLWEKLLPRDLIVIYSF